MRIWAWLVSAELSQNCVSNDVTIDRSYLGTGVMITVLQICGLEVQEEMSVVSMITIFSLFFSP